MRRAARIDRSQPEIVKELRAKGFSVRSTAAVGDGFSDIVVGWTLYGAPLACLFELKTPKHGTKKDTLARQEKFRAEWKGPLYKAKTTPEVLACMQDYERRVLAAVGVNVARDGGR